MCLYLLSLPLRFCAVWVIFDTDLPLFVKLMAGVIALAPSSIEVMRATDAEETTGKWFDPAPESTWFYVKAYVLFVLVLGLVVGLVYLAFKFEWARIALGVLVAILVVGSTVLELRNIWKPRQIDGRMFSAAEARKIRRFWRSARFWRLAEPPPDVFSALVTSLRAERSFRQFRVAKWTSLVHYSPSMPRHATRE